MVRETSVLWAASIVLMTSKENDFFSLDVFVAHLFSGAHPLLLVGQSFVGSFDAQLSQLVNKLEESLPNIFGFLFSLSRNMYRWMQSRGTPMSQQDIWELDLH